MRGWALAALRHGKQLKGRILFCGHCRVEVFVTTIPRYTAFTASTTSTIALAKWREKAACTVVAWATYCEFTIMGFFASSIGLQGRSLLLSISAFSGRVHRAVYSLSVSVGRVEGWTGHVWAAETSLEAVVPNSSTSITSTPSKASVDRQDVGSGASFGKKLREMTGPFNARNPFLVGPLYLADALAGLLPKRRKKIEEDRPLRVLVANWGHLGDVVNILPLLKFLEQNPRVQELGVLIGTWCRPVLESSDIAAPNTCS